jgi:hypothetical protein
MMKIPDPKRVGVRYLSLAAAAILMLSALPDRRAEAMSLINPAAAPAAQHASDGLTTEVRGGHGGGGHGGGHSGGFRGGGGFRGAAAFHAGGFRGGGAMFRGGGFRHGHRFGYRHHFHPRYYGYGPSYYYPHHHCRIVWTYYGPRRICHYPHWGHRWHHYGFPFRLFW